MTFLALDPLDALLYVAFEIFVTISIFMEIFLRAMSFLTIFVRRYRVKAFFLAPAALAVYVRVIMHFERGYHVKDTLLASAVRPEILREYSREFDTE